MFFGLRWKISPVLLSFNCNKNLFCLFLVGSNPKTWDPIERSHSTSFLHLTCFGHEISLPVGGDGVGFPLVNKFERVSSLGHQMSLALGTGGGGRALYEATPSSTSPRLRMSLNTAAQVANCSGLLSPTSVTVSK